MLCPQHPESAADLVPLPLVDGPKLEAFDFQGPQKIEFLEYLGNGTHSHVLKVKILGEIYALKLFFFPWPFQLINIATLGLNEEFDHEAYSAYALYSDLFYSECRAYGRLREADSEDLALKCFGYVLIDKEHEDIMTKQFSELREFGFEGDIEVGRYGDEVLRGVSRSHPWPREGMAQEIVVVGGVEIPEARLRNGANASMLRGRSGGPTNSTMVGSSGSSSGTNRILRLSLGSFEMAVCFPCTGVGIMVIKSAPTPPCLLPPQLFRRPHRP